LWIDVRFNTLFDAAGAKQITLQFAIGSTPTALLSWSDPRTFAEFFVRGENLAADPTFLMPVQPLRYNFQSVDGYGYLLASDAFNVSMVVVNGAPAVQIATWKMFYRFVDIPLSEFVGIVQSTQQS